MNGVKIVPPTFGKKIVFGCIGVKCRATLRRPKKIHHHLRQEMLVSGVYLVVVTKFITPRKGVPWCWGKSDIFGCTDYSNLRPIFSQSDRWIEKGGFRLETKPGIPTPASKKCLSDPNFFDRAIRSAHSVEKIDFFNGMCGSDFIARSKKLLYPTESLTTPQDTITPYSYACVEKVPFRSQLFRSHNQIRTFRRKTFFFNGMCRSDFIARSRKFL